MKRLSFLLTFCLLFALAAPAAAEETFRLESAALGCSLVVPGLSDEEVTTEVSGATVYFYHTPSRETGGLIGTLVAVAPRSAVFSEPYTDQSYRIVAMGRDRVFLWKSPGGGINSSGENTDGFVGAASALSVENLRKYLRPAEPDDLPVLHTQRHLAYLTAEDGLLRPDEPLTRGQLAEMLYALLEADNKNRLYEGPFRDVSSGSRCQAISYLASYGILSGYADGTFRPDEPVTRAQLAVLLHRCQFAVPVELYGDAEGFSDVPEEYWAADHINSAGVLGWMQGDAGGLFHPEEPVTLAQAVTAINRMLGRDESHTAVGVGLSPFSDVTSSHWAYENLLEAAGALTDDTTEPFAPADGDLPEGTSASAFLSEAEGWAVSGGQLLRTADGGVSWTPVGQPLSVTVSGLYFFDRQSGVLLGGGGETPLVLLETRDGGVTWRDLLADPDILAACLPLEQFGSEKAARSAILSAELRPAGKDAAYLLVRYHPYDSIYTLDLTAIRQTALISSVSSGTLTAEPVR